VTALLQVRVFSFLAGLKAERESEVGTKTVRSNREIHIHENVVEALKEENPAPLSVKPDAYLFSTPDGTQIDEANFCHREWLPILRAKKIHCGGSTTRHSYGSFLDSIGRGPDSSRSRQETASRRKKRTMLST
jgi:integrase